MTPVNMWKINSVTDMYEKQKCEIILICIVSIIRATAVSSMYSGSNTTQTLTLKYCTHKYKINVPLPTWNGTASSFAHDAKSRHIHTFKTIPKKKKLKLRIYIVKHNKVFIVFLRYVR